MHTQIQSETAANIGGASLPSLQRWAGVTPGWRLSLIGFAMQHYQFHLGDYIKDTAHLEPLEDLAYRRMIDLYYNTESPLPDDTKRISRLIRLTEDIVITILNEFFYLQNDGWHNKRCDNEIKKLYELSEKAREKAKKRWQCNSNAAALPQQCNSNAAGMLPVNPLTRNPIPETQLKPFAPSDKSLSAADKKINFDYKLGQWDGIEVKDARGWELAYPALDIETELFKAAEWVKANPANRKSNWRRFLTNWFARAQERAPRVSK